MRWFLIAYLLSNSCLAQNLPANFNLVSDPGFEFSQTNFDTAFGQQNNCWISSNKSGVLIWKNSLGLFSRRPRTGKSMGEYSYAQAPYKISTKQWSGWPGDTNSYSACMYFQTKLLKPLNAGRIYHFTFYVGIIKYSGNNSANPQYSIFSNIGAYFSNSKLSSYSSSSKIKLTPQLRFVNWDIPDMDTFEYAKLSGSFMATGGEQYLTIGNFDFYSQYNHLYSSSYYTGLDTAYSVIQFPFIDDISLVADTTQPMISLSEFSLGGDTTICPGDSIRLSGQPYFFHYWWNTGDTSRFITARQAGKYWCTVDYGCNTYTDTIVISNPSPPQFQLPNFNLCNTQVVNGPPGYSNYLWSTGATTPSITITSPGGYWLQVVNACGTAWRDTFIAFPQPPVVFHIPDTSICHEESLQVTAPAGYRHYLWSNGDTTNKITLYAPKGIYWLELTTSCGAVGRDSFKVNDLAIELPRPSLGRDTFNCTNIDQLAEIKLSVSPFPKDAVILWSTGSTDSAIFARKPGAYWVQLSNSCVSHLDTINLLGCPPKEIDYIWLPSAFSPNGDNINDVFRIPFPKAQLINLDIKIFNRWGKMVGHIIHPEDGWDGQGHDVGVYFYELYYQDVLGKEHIQKGDVSLIR